MVSSVVRRRYARLGTFVIALVIGVFYYTYSNGNSSLSKTPQYLYEGDEVNKNNKTDFSSEHNTIDCQQRFPKAIIAGFAKSGTTTLLKFLSVHPDIAALLKPSEPLFFNVYYDLGLNWYRRLMPCSYANQITIEKTPGYAWGDDVPSRIKKLNESIRLIFIVREPVRRIISTYTSHQIKTNHPEFHGVPLSDIVLLPDGNVKDTSMYVRTSSYYRCIKRWLKYFSLQQIHIVDGDNFARNPIEELQNVERFLGLRPYITRDHFIFDEEKNFYCIRSNDGNNCMGTNKGIKHVDIKDDVKTKLASFFKKENELFFSQIGKTFNWNPKK